MSIAIVIPYSWEPGELVRWSSTLARSKDKHLVIIRVRRLANRHKPRKNIFDAATDNSPLMVAIREHAGDFEPADHKDPRFQGRKKSKSRGTVPTERSVFLIELDHTELVDGVLKEIKALRLELLIVPRRQGVPISEEEAAVERQLFTHVPCEVLQLRPGRRFNDPRDPILVATHGKQPAKSTLKLGAAMAAVDDSQVTAVYVRQEAPATPRKKRKRRATANVRDAPNASVEQVPPTAQAARDIPSGVRSYAAATGHDMLFVGEGDHLTDDRAIRACLPTRLMAEVDDSTIVVVRGAITLKGRVYRSIEEHRKSLVPQLDRSARIELVRRLQSTAEWDFDFLILIFLATLLAALGLVVDSAPVVIGAMLVAPLMAPMLGIGMSVVQGNRQMADKCLATVGRGFLLAFATGCGVGILRLVFASGITEEISKRAAPNVLDLAIAFVSGMVAAYAFGRPHLLSVVPGIAIASSLVPPVAASGLSLVALNLDVALGAVLLFLSNFVAIVLGSTFSLWVVGLRGPREVNPFTTWAQQWMWAFFAVSVCLAVFFSITRDGSEVRAAVVIPTSQQESQATNDPRPSEPSTPPGEQRPQTAASSNAGKSQPSPNQANNPNVQVVQKPIVEPAPQTAGESQGSSVTVVIPSESPGEERNTSVQIEGLPSEHVAEILGKVLNKDSQQNHAQPAAFMILAVALIALAYLGWRLKHRT